jgi:Zn-dependent M16 (insulinase) family peptidase
LDLLLEYRNDLESSLAPSGNQYAVSRAAYPFSRAKAIDEAWNGISQIRFVRDLARAAREKGGVEALGSRLDAIRKRLASAGLVVNLTGAARALSSLEGALSACLSGRGAPDRPASTQIGDFLRLASITGPVERETANVAEKPAVFETLELASASLQVGFASLVLPSPAFGKPDQGIDVVLGHWLANGPSGSGSGPRAARTAHTPTPTRSRPCSSSRPTAIPNHFRSLDVFRDVIAEAAESEIDPVALERTITGLLQQGGSTAFAVG